MTESPPLLQRIRALVSNPARQREWTAVANDAIVATAGILEGFAAAGAEERALIIAATMGTVAGTLAVGGSRWAEAAAERDAQLAAMADEANSLSVSPEAELAELAAHYEGRGLTPELAREVAVQLSARDALGAQLATEHGIHDVSSRADALIDGIGVAIAYALAASIPLVITALVPLAIEGPLILVATVVALLVTSTVGARSAHIGLRHAALRALAVGIGTLAISYAVGQVVF